MPLVTALAGPLGLWLWTVVVVVSVWALAAGPAAARTRTGHAPGRAVGRRRHGADPCRGRVSAGAGRAVPGGDEPHYLVVTQSVLTDRDLRIDDNHARGDYRAYFRAALKPHHIVPPGADGAIYSIHPIGVSLLVAPGFALAAIAGPA